VASGFNLRKGTTESVDDIIASFDGATLTIEEPASHRTLRNYRECRADGGDIAARAGVEE